MNYIDLINKYLINNIMSYLSIVDVDNFTNVYNIKNINWNIVSKYLLNKIDIDYLHYRSSKFINNMFKTISDICINDRFKGYKDFPNITTWDLARYTNY